MPANIGKHDDELNFDDGFSGYQIIIRTTWDKFIFLFFVAGGAKGNTQKSV